MVDTILIVGIIGLAIVGLILVLSSRGTTSSKINQVPTLQDAISQIDLGVQPVPSTDGIIGFVEGKANSDSSIDEIKANILSNNLLTEDAVRKLILQEQNKTQISTDSGGKGTQTKEVQGIQLFASDTSSLKVQEAFAPAGEGEFLSIRGTPLAENAIARTEETFSGTLTTKDGGTRTIRGSKALFDRLQSNLQQSSI